MCVCVCVCVCVCLNRKTVAHRVHVVMTWHVRRTETRCADRAIAARFLYHNWVTKSYGDHRETTKARLEVLGTPYGHRTDSVRSPLKVCGDPVTAVRSPSAFLTQNVDESHSLWS